MHHGVERIKHLIHAFHHRYNSAVDQLEVCYFKLTVALEFEHVADVDPDALTLWGRQPDPRSFLWPSHHSVSLFEELDFRDDFNRFVHGSIPFFPSSKTQRASARTSFS